MHIEPCFEVWNTAVAKKANGPHLALGRSGQGLDPKLALEFTNADGTGIHMTS